MKKFFLAFIGGLLILAGIAGLILPILPGWVLIFMGLSLIAPKLAERLKRRVLRKFSKQEIVYLENWRKRGVHAGFTTKHFPVFLSKTGDLEDPIIQENFKRELENSPIALAHGVTSLSKFVFLNQVHGDKIVMFTDESKFEKGNFFQALETDGAITNVKKLTLLVMTADCLSIFFSAGEWVGVVHAGWRGTQKEIAKKAFRLILEKAKCKRSDVHIAFGPCIGRDSYEVGPEFKKIFPKSDFHKKRGKLFFDLAEENRRQLLRAGALERCIIELDICTVRENDDYYSFRKEGPAAGRMVSFITNKSQQ